MGMLMSALSFSTVPVVGMLHNLFVLRLQQSDEVTALAIRECDLARALNMHKRTLQRKLFKHPVKS